MIPTENIEVKPDGQLVLQRNTKDLVVQGDAVFTGDIDAQNGVLQIDQIELPAGATQSVKKIYCHPLEFYKDGAGIFTALLFNNSPTKLDTWQKVKDAIASFGGTTYNRLAVSGAWNHGTDKVCICSEIVHYVGANEYRINGVDTDGTVVIGSIINITNETFTSIVDDTNPIN